ERRRRLFLLGAAVGLALAILGAVLQGEPFVFLAPWMFYTALLAFILGTFYRIDFRRSEESNIRLARTWPLCFFTQSPVRIPVKNYQGVVTGMGTDADFWTWFMAFLLFLYAIVPAVLWWYYVIHQDAYYVALTQGHGATDLILYRGRSQSQAEEIAATL